MTSPVENMLQVARWLASKAAPYMAHGLFAMTFVPAPPEMGLKTIAIDEQWRVYYNEAYIAACHADKTLQGEIMHECLHRVLHHARRARIINAIDHDRWNRAGDAELDQRIEEMKIKLVEDRVKPEHFEGGKPGMTAEELYRLPCKPQQSQKPCHCGGGSGAGNPLPGELSAKPAAGQPAGLSDHESDVIRAAVAMAIRDYATKQGRGAVPAGLLRWAEDYQAPVKVDWKTIAPARIRHAIDKRRGGHPSYARPSRRGSAGGIVLPVYRSTLPRVAVVCDTSASMLDSDEAKALGVVWDASATLGKIFACACDASAGDLVEVRQLDDLREAFKGGGGTDMAVGITTALDCNPDAIIVVTDGDTPWPAEEPEAPVIVILTRDTHIDQVPAWAETILADD